MTAVARLVTRGIVIVCLLSATVTPAPQASVDAATVPGEGASVRSEVRLRKLHLVRPDLIPYPIAYEVNC
jgi:hypothetical protein